MHGPIGRRRTSRERRRAQNTNEPGVSLSHRLTIA